MQSVGELVDYFLRSPNSDAQRVGEPIEVRVDLFNDGSGGGDLRFEGASSGALYGTFTLAGNKQLMPDVRWTAFALELAANKDVSVSTAARALDAVESWPAPSEVVEVWRQRQMRRLQGYLTRDRPHTIWQAVIQDALQQTQHPLAGLQLALARLAAVGTVDADRLQDALNVDVVLYRDHDAEHELDIDEDMDQGVFSLRILTTTRGDRRPQGSLHVPVPLNHASQTLPLLRQRAATLSVCLQALLNNEAHPLDGDGDDWKCTHCDQQFFSYVDLMHHHAGHEDALIWTDN